METRPFTTVLGYSDDEANIALCLLCLWPPFSIVIVCIRKMSLQFMQKIYVATKTAPSGAALFGLESVMNRATDDVRVMRAFN